MNTFGDFLYTLRKEKGMTQAELAELLGITNKAVSKWETGEAMPETSLLLPIAKIFDVTVDELLEGKLKSNFTKETDSEFTSDGVKHIFKHDKEEITLLDKISGAVCAVVMFIGIFAYLLIGLLAEKWYPYWVIIPISALSCGVIGIIFDMCNKVKRDRKIEKGENPYCGGVCGLITIVCFIVYLLLGALLGLWHPLWIILVGGALVSGVIGSICGIISHKS